MVPGEDIIEIELDIEVMVKKHRHDIVARVFRLKLIHLTNVITKSQIFGSVRCYMYTVEWQKRGLPHAHFLIWLCVKIHPNEIDAIVSAELPDPDKDGELFRIIKSHMVHGPCGVHNFNSTCMKDGRCSKRYPNPFLKETQTGEDGYPSYRRRSPQDGGVETSVGRHQIDNRWIVPYCPWLSRVFDAHINVEFCNSVKSIKYICKYINKGSDAAMFTIESRHSRDEVAQYQLGRYISTNEAFWRIFGFPIHERFPPVQTLEDCNLKHYIREERHPSATVSSQRAPYDMDIITNETRALIRPLKVSPPLSGR